MYYYYFYRGCFSEAELLDHSGGKISGVQEVWLVYRGALKFTPHSLTIPIKIFLQSMMSAAKMTESLALLNHH